MITISQLLESVDLDFEPRWVTKDEDGSIWIWNIKPDRHETWHLKQGVANVFYGRFISERLKLSEFDGKDWTECIYEVPRKTTGKIEPIYVPRGEDFAGSGVYAIELAKRLNQVIDAVNEINENYACIAALTDIRKRLDTLEKCVKNKGGEE